VGNYVRGGGLWGALTEHWDGTAWSVVPTVPRSSDTLAAVAAVAANDVWAVGTSDDQTLAVHWDGQAWTLVPTPNIGTAGNALLGAAAVAAGDVWAVGRYYDQSRFWDQTLTLHWDGQAWRVVPSPNTTYGANLLYAVTALAANEVWAVGMGNGWTLTERWDGTAWSIVPSPNAGNNEHDLYGVAAGSSGDIWAVGRYRNVQAAYHTLLEHWNGSTWGVAPGPTSGPYDNILYGVAARTGTDIWAVGTGSNDTLILHYTAWPCSPVTPGPTRTPSSTRTITPAPSHSMTPAATGTRTASPSPTRTGTPGGTAGTPTVAATPPACLVQFNDVPGTNTFYTTIRCLACRGIVGGYPCGGPGEPCPGAYFRPNNNLTRGQVSKIVAEAAGLSDPVPSTRQTFEDVAPGSTFWLWIERLSGRGIVGGYPCGGPFEPCIAPANRPYFRPNNNATRGQMSKVATLAFFPTCSPVP
jgi:hypothetical protein